MKINKNKIKIKIFLFYKNKNKKMITHLWSVAAMTIGREVGVLMTEIWHGRPDGESLRDVIVVSGVMSNRQTLPITPPTTPLVLSFARDFGEITLDPGDLAGGEDDTESAVDEVFELLKGVLSRVWLLLFSGLGLGDSLPPKLAVSFSAALFFFLFIPEVEPQRPRENPRFGLSDSSASFFFGEEVPLVRVRERSTTSVTPVLTAPPMTPTALRPRVRDLPTAAEIFFGAAGGFAPCSSGKSSLVSTVERMPQGTTSMSLLSQPPARVMRW